jgi:hypothetical protein
MKHCEIWFGKMTHGEFSIGNDSSSIVMINSIDEKAIMDPVDVDEYMVSQGHDSYLIPSQFKGEIVYSVDFFKTLIG